MLCVVGRDGGPYRQVPLDREGLQAEATRPAGVPQQQVRPRLRGVQRQNLGLGMQPSGEIMFAFFYIA